MKDGYYYRKTLVNFSAAFLASSATFTAAAGNLNLSDNALEVANNVEPNIMILHDDSGSMDWGIMTNEDGEGTFHLDGIPYYYTHPDPGASGGVPAENDENDDWVVPTEEFLQSQGIPSPQGGVWRAWNHNYNKVYYNPNVTYTPWKGKDSTGNTFGNALFTAAPYNPNVPANGSLDLTSTITYETDCGLSACTVIPLDDGKFEVTNYYPARYYTWDDNNAITPSNAGNGVVDADDNHVLVEIKSSTPSYVRKSYDAASKTGRSDCFNNGDGTATCSYNQEIQNFANWFSYYRKRDLAAKGAFSNIIDPLTSTRVGYATINNNAGNTSPLASMNLLSTTGNKKDLLDKLFATVPDDGTPLRSALEKTGKYFECKSGDIMGSASDSLPGAAGCAVQAAPEGTCQANYTVLITDGYWNGVDPAVGNADSDGAGDFDGKAFADSHTNTLADMAMHYYETDLHGTLDNDVPTSKRDIAGYFGSTNPFKTMHQHMALYTVGFGIQGTLTSGPTDLSSSFAWPDPTLGDPQKVDDVMHAAINGRGLHSSVSDPQALEIAMKNILNDIKANSGTATAVAFNTQEVEAGSLVYRASFNTITNTGDLIAQEINPDGSINPAIEWSAADKLDAATSSSSDSRVIVTYKDTGTSTSTGIPFKWANLTTGAGSQQEQLNTPVPAVGENRLDYLRGHTQHEGTNFAAGEMRIRDEKRGKLGDIVHSTPIFVGKPSFIGRNAGAYPTSTYYSEFVEANLTRKQLVYVGANDGMMHAFDANTGVEHFAFVPNSIIKRLPELTDPSYTHKFFLDLTPSVNDIWFTPAKGTNAGSASWNTVLVGGLGAGGIGYFALNINDPSALSSEAGAANNVLWEFTEADDGGAGVSHLGYSYSEPLIAMSNAVDGNGDAIWVAIFGNGYNSASADGDAHLYAVSIQGGQDGVWSYGTDFIKISTENGKLESSDGTTPNGIGGVRGIDTDDNGTVDVVYAGDYQGNLYKFDLSGTSMSDWDDATPTTLFKAQHEVTTNNFVDQPITKRPVVINHPENGYLVIFGTGSWMTDDDSGDTSIQSLYGIWDKNNGNLVSADDLVEQTFTNQVSKVHGYTVRTVSNNPLNWSPNKDLGWVINLDVSPAGAVTGVEFPGERAVRNLQIRDGILFINTVIPRGTDSCTTGAGGFELAINPVTGGVTNRIAFDLNNDNSFTVLDNVGQVDHPDNVVAGMRFDNAVPTDSSFIGTRRLTQAGDEIRSVNTNTGGPDGTGRTSWREIK